MALFDELPNLFLTQKPEYLKGLLNADMAKTGVDKYQQLQNQSNISGLLNTFVNYIAQPKNQGYGSIIPYAAKSYLAGTTGAQNVYDTKTKNVLDALNITKTSKQIEMEGMTDLDKLIYNRKRLQETDPNSPYLKAYDDKILKESGGFGSFGQSVEGTSLGILSRGSQNTPEGEGIRKTTQYALAYREATSPKTIMQETMDANGNVYTVPVKINQSALPPNILPPIYGEQGVQTQPVDVTKPSITSQSNQVTTQTKPVAAPTQSPIIKKVSQTKQDIFKQEQDIRKDYITTPEVKNFGEVRSAFNIIDSALKNESPAGDLSAATKFMKILDPNSVVRESELAMAMSATGLTDKAQNYFQLLTSGQKLNPAQRADFRKVATDLYKAAEGVKLNYDKQYADIATSNNLDPAKIIMGYKVPQTNQNAGGFDLDAISKELKRRKGEK